MRSKKLESKMAAFATMNQSMLAMMGSNEA